MSIQLDEMRVDAARLYRNAESLTERTAAEREIKYAAIRICALVDILAEEERHRNDVARRDNEGP